MKAKLRKTDSAKSVEFLESNPTAFKSVLIWAKDQSIKYKKNV
jgi:hypothetical protein